MMKVLRIEATRDFIRLHTDSDGPALLRECVPTVGPKPGRVLITTGKKCKNPRCISSTEQGLEPLFYPVHQVMRHGELVRIPTKYVCAYCDMEQV